MTKEELRKHCEKEIRICEFWAHGRKEELNNNKIYQEHKLILELLEQEPILDKIRTEIEALEEGITSYHNDRPWIYKDEVLEILDKYKEESKVEE